MADHEVRLRTWVKATEAEIRTGLCGYVSVVYGDLILDGIVLRKTTDGRFALSFPARTDRSRQEALATSAPRPTRCARRSRPSCSGSLGERPEFTP
jgi:hypothetical protein